MTTSTGYTAVVTAHLPPIYSCVDMPWLLALFGLRCAAAVVPLGRHGLAFKLACTSPAHTDDTIARWL